MRSVLTILTLGILAGACGTELDDAIHDHVVKPVQAVITATREQIESQQVVPGSYLVAFKNDLPSGGLFYSSYFKEYQSHYLNLSEKYYYQDGVKDIQYLTSLDLSRPNLPVWNQQFVGPRNLDLNWNVKNIPPSPASITRIDFSDNEAAEELLAKWGSEGKIWYAEPNYMNNIKAGESSFVDYKKTYEEIETSHSDVDWFKQINLAGGFEALGDGEIDTGNVPIIAVMDSGVDYEHPALVDNIWRNNQQNVSQAGCLLDWNGCNTTQSSKGFLGNGDVWPASLSAPGQSCTGSEIYEPCAHGTHVAGLIAAKPQADFGGICPVCKIMVVKVVGKTKRGEGGQDSIIDSSIVAGFAYISRFRKHGDSAVRIVNVSFGKFQRSRTVEMLIRVLKDEGRGTLVVGAAGNEDTMLRQYPAAFNDVIAVSNVDSGTGAKHWASNFGTWVDISAPGGGYCNGRRSTNGLRSSIPGGETECMPGTSMAAPVVAGVAGLLLVQNPELTSSELRDILIRTSDPKVYDITENSSYITKVSFDSTPVPLLGSGLVNVSNAVGRIYPDGALAVKNYHRISSGCGVLGVREKHANAPLSLLFILFFPIAIIFSLRFNR